MNSILSALKELPGLITLGALDRTPASQWEGLSFSLLEDGLPKGALIEVSGAAGSGKTEITLRFLAENPRLRVAWIESEWTAYPCAFEQHRVSLSRVLFLESGHEALWTAHQTVRSGLFGIVVIHVGDASNHSEMALRRLQLAAERSGATVVLLTETPARRGTWPIAVQLRASRSFDVSEAGDSIALQVLKYRGQRSWQLNVG